MNQYISPYSFFRVAYSIFQQAEKDSPTAFTRSFNIARRRVRLRFANDRLAYMFTPAFEHLAVRHAEHLVSDLDICIIDSASTHKPLYMPRWQSRDYLRRGELQRYSNDQIITTYNYHDGTFNLVNLQDNIAIFWARDHDTLPWWIAGSPLQRIINCWMQKHGLQLTHAGAVGNKSGGILLAGKGGAGKSTTALACMDAGLYYVSEDYCLIGHEPQPYVHSVYNSAKLEPNTMLKFPHLEPFVANKNKQPHEKALIFQQDVCPQRIIDGFPIRAVFVPKRTDNHATVIEPCSKASALLALSASTMFQLSNCYQPTLRNLKQLLTSVPAYSLLLGTNLDLVTSSIIEFLGGEKMA